jgi:hypothetical protein
MTDLEHNADTAAPDEQPRGRLVVGGVGRGQLGGERDPDRRDGGREVERPAVDPAVPARLGPAGLGVDRGVRDDPGVAGLLVPDPATRAQQGAVDRVPAGRPRVEQPGQGPPQAPDPGWQGARQRRPPTLPGAPTREATALREAGPERLHLPGRLLQDRQQPADRRDVADQHDHQRLQEQPLRVDRRAPKSRRLGRGGDHIDQVNEREQHRSVRYHEQACLVWSDSPMVGSPGPPVFCPVGPATYDRASVSYGTINAIIQEAQRRAQAWLASHAPPSSRPLALDEMYGNDRRGAYLHIVDTASHAVWAAEGPVPVDTEKLSSTIEPCLGHWPGSTPATTLTPGMPRCTALGGLLDGTLRFG